MGRCRRAGRGHNPGGCDQRDLRRNRQTHSWPADQEPEFVRGCVGSGRRAGENRRLAVVVLTGWRDCLVSVSDDRRYYFCSVGSFTDLKKAEAEAAEIAADIGKNCLGSLWRVNPTTVPPNISSLRLVASGTEAAVTIRPTKRLTSEIWDIHIEIEP
jgi:hypothetical protein